MIIEEYNTGEQPCGNFTPEDEYEGYQVHTCYCGHKRGLTCTGTVSFCHNCYHDHHQYGYNKCVCEGKGFIN